MGVIDAERGCLAAGWASLRPDRVRMERYMSELKRASTSTCRVARSLAFLAAVGALAGCGEGLDAVEAGTLRPDCASDADCKAPGRCWKAENAETGFCDTDSNGNGQADLTDSGLRATIEHRSCQSNPCPAGAVCNAEVDFCIVIGAQPEGAVCAEKGDCLAGLLCGIAHKCIPGLQGQPCKAGSECVSGFCQRQSAETTGACGTGAAEEQCVTDDDCSGIICNSFQFCGEVSQGAPCKTAADCQGSACNSKNSCGKLQNGLPCGVATDCSGGFCGRTDPVADGVCGSGQGGDLCVGDKDCQPDLGCNSLHYCGPVVGGEKCATGKDCLDGYCNSFQQCGGRGPGSECKVAKDCVSGYCSASATCGKVTAGKTCKVGLDCTSGYCQHKTGAETGKCGAGKDGEDCSGVADCVSAYCNSMAACGKVAAAAPCELGSDCASAYCQHEAGLSAGLCGDGSLGSNCDGVADCVVGSYCGVGKCTSGVGTPCTDNSQCQIECVYVKAMNAGWCKAVPDGKGCYKDGDCASGRCVYVKACTNPKAPPPGICATGKEGSACLVTLDCDKGLICPATYVGYPNSLDSDSKNLQEKCAYGWPPAPSSCSVGEKGAKCFSDAHCGGSSCIGDGVFLSGYTNNKTQVTKSAGKCGPVGIGELCESNIDIEKQTAALCSGAVTYMGEVSHEGQVTSIARHLPRWPAEILLGKGHLVFDTKSNTATSSKTGLMWQLQVPGIDVKNGKKKVHLLETAPKYCKTLSLAGHSDWRVPSHAESLTIIDSKSRYFYSEFGPSSVPSGYGSEYWPTDTVGTKAADGSSGWEAKMGALRSKGGDFSNLINGWDTATRWEVYKAKFYTGGQQAQYWRIRCVRDLKPISDASPYEFSTAEGWFKHQDTGLQWLLPAPMPAIPETAGTVCKSLTVGGGGWRVATIAEYFVEFGVGPRGVDYFKSAMGQFPVNGTYHNYILAGPAAFGLVPLDKNKKEVLCVRDVAVACQAPGCDDGNVCTIDSCGAGGKCENKAVADGAACGAGKACKAGVCVAGAPTCDPAKCDDNNVCTDDGCGADGKCENKVVADGAACGAGKACKAGVCAAGAPTCDPAKCGDNNACTADGCGADGKCQNEAVADGAACGAGKTCKAGICKVGVPACDPAKCSDNTICTDDGCGADGKCENKAVADGAACGAGKTCKSGKCEVAGPAHYCDTHCGAKAPSGCYCDTECKKYGDCCDASGAKNAGASCAGSTCNQCN